MSSAINVDRITPKNSSSIRLDGRVISAGGVSLQPYTQSLSAPVNVGSFTAVATQTGTITLDGGVWYLNLDAFTAPNTHAYAGSVATCSLLTGTPAIPTEDKFFNAMMSEDGSKDVLGSVKIDSTGTITYNDAPGLGWASDQYIVVYGCVVKYKI